MAELPNVAATRYVQPLREGGSLPAVVDTEAGMYVVKFRGAGQGPKALVAELIAGMIAAELGLATPELALVSISELFGRGEPDPEIQDILRASHGANVGLRYLDGAFNFALSAAGDLVDPEWATRVVWLDAYLTNPDRTHRNTNLLVWDRRVWLIDHGAALYAHHDWPRVDDARTRAGFPLIRSHVVLGRTEEIERVDEESAAKLTEAVLEGVLRGVPDSLLAGEGAGDDFPDARAARERYLCYLLDRLRGPRAFVRDIVEARTQLLADPDRPIAARR